MTLKVKGWCTCAHGKVRVILDLEADRREAVQWADAFFGAHMLHDGFRFEVRALGGVAPVEPQEPR